MARLNDEDFEELESPILETVKKLLPDMISAPIFVALVSRKLNTGNYENLTIGAAISLPVICDLNNLEELKATIENTAEHGFAIASEQVGDRWRELKNLQRQGRSAQDAPNAP